MSLTFKPKSDKIVELLLYLAHRLPEASKYQAVKLFYLADKQHLERYGRPITFETYYAMEYGPVGTTTKDLIEEKPKALADAGISALPFALHRTRKANGEDKRVLGKPLRDTDFTLFSKSDIAVFDEVLERYGQFSFDDLYDETHRHDAYTQAWAKRGTSKRYPMDYAEMIEEPGRRAALLAELGPVAAFL